MCSSYATGCWAIISSVRQCRLSSFLFDRTPWRPLWVLFRPVREVIILQVLRRDRLHHGCALQGSWCIILCRSVPPTTLTPPAGQTLCLSASSCWRAQRGDWVVMTLFYIERIQSVTTAAKWRSGKDSATWGGLPPGYGLGNSSQYKSHKFSSPQDRTQFELCFVFLFKKKKKYIYYKL